MKNYKPFLWRRLRAKLFVAGLLNCTEDVPKYRSSDTDTPTMMFDETDLHNAVALDLLEKRKVTGSYEWEWYAAKKKGFSARGVPPIFVSVRLKYH